VITHPVSSRLTSRQRSVRIQERIVTGSRLRLAISNHQRLARSSQRRLVTKEKRTVSQSARKKEQRRYRSAARSNASEIRVIDYLKIRKSCRKGTTFLLLSELYRTFVESNLHSA
jgi:hypothetical protein